MGDTPAQITQQGMAILYIIVAAFGLGMCFTDIVNELQKEEPWSLARCDVTRSCPAGAELVSTMPTAHAGQRAG